MGKIKPRKYEAEGQNSMHYEEEMRENERRQGN